MEKISKEEMKNIKGGGLSVWAIMGIGALATFFLGVVDGFVRPIKCER